MDTKWLAIMVLGIMVAFCGAIAVTETARGRCREKAIEQRISPENTDKICH